LVLLLQAGRFFFKKTGLSVNSSDNWLNHFVSKEVLNGTIELNQLQLNIQLLYIKLASYDELLSRENLDVSTRRHVFAHVHTRHVFGKDVNYNFFLHKVSENFKKIQFIFYDEEGMDNPESAVKTVDLELDKDIRIFLQIWSKAEENVSDPSASADTAKVR
jgi:hypothetical protein